MNRPAQDLIMYRRNSIYWNKKKQSRLKSGLSSKIIFVFDQKHLDEMVSLFQEDEGLPGSRREDT